jgi:hypothetical protein
MGDSPGDAAQVRELGNTTFPRLAWRHAAERPQAPALREKDLGIWQTLTWRDLRDEVEAHRSRSDRPQGLMPAPSSHWWARTGRGCTRP